MIKKSNHKPINSKGVIKRAKSRGDNVENKHDGQTPTTQKIKKYTK